MNADDDNSETIARRLISFPVVEVVVVARKVLLGLVGREEGQNAVR
jgi:hypothetical protein